MTQLQAFCRHTPCTHTHGSVIQSSLKTGNIQHNKPIIWYANTQTNTHSTAAMSAPAATANVSECRGPSLSNCVERQELVARCKQAGYGITAT
jgi:hypothetical protein